MFIPDLIPPINPAVQLAKVLAQQINDREKKIVKATLEHFKQQGEDLLEVRKCLRQKKFNPWVKENLPFSRQTAYNYMKIAKNWTTICQRGLQMHSFRQVVTMLFGERKAAKKAEPTPSSETESSGIEQGNTGPSAEESRTEAEQVENVTVPSEPDHKTQAEECLSDSQAKEGEDSSSKTAVVLQVKNLQVTKRFRDLMQELLFYDCEGYLARTGRIPKQIGDIAGEEERPVQLLLALIQSSVDACRSLKQKNKKTSSRAEKSSTTGNRN
jgi:hypothetical protein